MHSEPAIGRTVADVPPSPASASSTPVDERIKQAQALFRKHRAPEAEAILAEILREGPSPEAARRLTVIRLLHGNLPGAEPLREQVRGLVGQAAAMWVVELWTTARRCGGSEMPAAAAFATILADDQLAADMVLPAMEERQLREGLHADSLYGSGRNALYALGYLLRRTSDRSFVIKFFAGLGGNRPHLGQRPRLEQLASVATAICDETDADPVLRDGAALILYATQNFTAGMRIGIGAAPGSTAATVTDDSTMRVEVGAELRAAALAGPPRGRVVPKDQPPFIVVHRGGQDYVRLCAASLALQNGANNVVLLGDASTATIGVGRYAAIADYFEGAARLAQNFVHHSIMEATYGLFSFQRWLMVEEYCRKNRIDQCVVIDSDALAFSSASEIIETMPAGYLMNDWTWTTTVRDTRALGALAEFTQAIYVKPPEEIAAIAHARGRSVANGAARSFQDMHLFYYFRDTHTDQVVSQYRIPMHGGLDQAAAMDNGVETGLPNDLVLAVPGLPLKRPLLDDGKLYFRKSGEDGSLVRFHTVHCQGPAKAAMHHYAALSLPRAQDALARWRAVPRAVETPPATPPTPIPATAPPEPEAGQAVASDTDRKPLPNLRLPENLELRDRLRARVDGLGELDSEITLSLPDGPRVAAGDTLAVSVTLVNRCDASLPILVEGHEALVLGFEFLTETPEGLRSARHARLSLPVEDLPANGAPLTVTGLIRANKLAPGRYHLAVDLLFDHLRWFQKDPAKRVGLPVEVTG